MNWTIVNAGVDIGRKKKLCVCYEAPQDELGRLEEEPEALAAIRPFRCVMTVDEAGIVRNLAEIRRWIQGQIIAVVKNNGYGLGLVPYARLLAGQGVHCFAVARLEEAIVLRQAGFTQDILLMTPPQDAQQAMQIVRWKVSAAAGSMEHLAWLEQASVQYGSRCPVHIKFDTGFGRYGFSPETASTLTTIFKQSAHLDMEGLFSHCGILEPGPAQRQFASFCQAVQVMEKAGYQPRYRHFCNSSLAMLYPTMQLDAVRIGSALLGRLPCRVPAALERIGQLRARVISIHDMPAGSRPGYAGVQRLGKRTPVAVINAGWQEGLGLERKREIYQCRHLFSQMKKILMQMNHRCYATWNGRRLPVIGWGGMTFTLLDASDCDLTVGDWVTMEVNPLMVPREVRREYISQ